MENRYLEQLKGTVLNMMRGQSTRVFLFGSRARQDHRPTSDVDIGVLSSDPSTPSRIALLRERIEEMNIPYKVEVVNFTEVSLDFREQALRDAVVWQE
jgi:predicted nucleotidyltransferase